MLRRNIKINFPIRFTYRTIYVIFTTFVAITLVRQCLMLGLRVFTNRRAPAALLRGGGSVKNSVAPRFADSWWRRSARRPAPACRSHLSVLDAVSDCCPAVGPAVHCSPFAGSQVQKTHKTQNKHKTQHKPSLCRAQPFFGDLLGFIGAIATGPTTFWIPPLMWIILYRPVLTDVSPFAPCCCPWQLLLCTMSCCRGCVRPAPHAACYRYRCGAEQCPTQLQGGVTQVQRPVD